MTASQPYWPRRWLMTDERIGERLWEAIDRLPSGDGGIIFRHYDFGDAERLELGLKLAKGARERGLMIGVAGSRKLAELLGASLVHNPDGPGELPHSMAVHNATEALAARDSGAALVFISPVHATRSHPGRRGLGVDRATELATLAGCCAIALGGMNEGRFAELESAHPGKFHGYAGIDCWLD